MIFDAETDKGCETPTGWGRIGGPVSAKNGWPEAVQGEYSLLVMSSTDKAALYYTLPETLDATKYEYIEFDIYFASNLFADFEVGLCSDVADTVGATWKMKEAWFCPDKWTHVKIPVSAFGNFTETYSGNLNSINQVVFKFTKVFDTYELWETGKLVTPAFFDLQLDNVIATNGDAGKDNELIDYNTMMLDPYIEWDILPTPPTPPSITMYGDADNNYCIDAADALCVLQHAVGKVFLGNTTKSDVNGDDVVTAQDALLILQCSVGKITKFPVEVAQLPDTLMLFDCETSEGCGIYTEQQGTHYGPVSENAQFGSPKPVQGDYTYCIYTKGNQMMLNYTFPKSVDLSIYDYIEFDIYSYLDIVFRLNIDIATDTAAITGANWGMYDSWIPSKRWIHVKIPVSAFSEIDGSLTDINRIRFLLTNILDGVKYIDEGWPTTPDYTYVYFDNIIATKNGAGKDNDLIDVDTLFENPPEWDDYYGDDVTCGGGLYLPAEVLFDAETSEGCEVYTEQFANEDLIGLTEANSYSGAPTPTRGNYTYCINTTSNQIEFSRTLSNYYNITPHNYIEFDIYSNQEIVFNLKFNVTSLLEDTTGATWRLSSAWLPAKRWTHVKIPISAFSDSTGIYGGSFEKVKQIKIELSNIVDGQLYVFDGLPKTPDNTYIYIDDVIATTRNSTTENELIDTDTLFETPPVWFEEYRRQFEQF